MTRSEFINMLLLPVHREVAEDKYKPCDPPVLFMINDQPNTDLLDPLIVHKTEEGLIVMIGYDTDY